ncbi:MAG: hypothetical protein AAF709_01240 [Pseudomonadota bacterium]
MAQWREEMAGANERYSDKVFAQMSKAAGSMGWPDNLVEQMRDQVNASTKVQFEMMDKVMEAWRDQIKSADTAMASPTDFMKQMQDMQKSMTGGNGPYQNPMMPDMMKLGGMPMAPMHFWMQASEMWQKNMTTAMSMWMSGAQQMAKQMDPTKRR